MKFSQSLTWLAAALLILTLGFSNDQVSAETEPTMQKAFTDFFCKRNADGEYDLYHASHPDRILDGGFGARTCGSNVHGNFYCKRQADGSYNLHHAYEPDRVLDGDFDARTCGTSIVKSNL